jgi:chemotaxis protein MotB
MSATHDPNESGISVYPPLPVPKRRNSDERKPSGGHRTMDRRLIAVVAVSVIVGGAGAWFLQPVIAPDARIAAANKRASEAEETARAQRDRANALEASLDIAAKAKREAEAKLTGAETAQAQLAGRTADDATQRKAAEAVQARLKTAIDRTTGAITIEGTEVHLQISDRVLFKPNDDALSDRGKAVLGKIAAALEELPDRLVRVQGHTDDQVAPPVKPPPPPAKRGQKPAAVAAPVVRFPTSWELSSARALSVVHYFQDVAKLDPARLAALAFGQYAPLSKTDRSANRRIKIVIAGKPPAK